MSECTAEASGIFGYLSRIFTCSDVIGIRRTRHETNEGGFNWRDAEKTEGGCMSAS